MYILVKYEGLSSSSPIAAISTGMVRVGKTGEDVLSRPLSSSLGSLQHWP